MSLKHELLTALRDAGTFRMPDVDHDLHPISLSPQERDYLIGLLSATPEERPCMTCNGDPAVCATVPGLRHCEAATRTDGVMTEERARTELAGMIQPDGGLYDGGHYVAWTPGETDACLDCKFTADELEAIAWWMRNGTPPQRVPE